MNEVEKMYKLAKVKAINIAEYGSTYIPQVVEIDGKLYPPFTAEKQLELIKWLINKGQFRIERCLSKYYFEFRDYDLHTRKYFTQMTFLTLEEGVSFVINNLWQSLTDAERKQIKEILE